jgi:hypothetical protein
MVNQKPSTLVLGKFCISHIEYVVRRLTERRYCFGAPYVCDELAGDGVAAGAFGHPAFLKEHHFMNLKSKVSILV